MEVMAEVLKEEGHDEMEAADWAKGETPGLPVKEPKTRPPVLLSPAMTMWNFSFEGSLQAYFRHAERGGGECLSDDI